MAHGTPDDHHNQRHGDEDHSRVVVVGGTSSAITANPVFVSQANGNLNLVGLVSVSPPAGVATGDFLLMQISSSTTGYTRPAGWTDIVGANQGLAYKYYAGEVSYDFDVTVQDDRRSVVISAWRGVSATAPINASQFGTFGSGVLSGITTTVNNCLLVGLYDNFGTTVAPDATMTERWELADGSGLGTRFLEGCDVPMTTIGASGAKTPTSGNPNFVYNALLALAPERLGTSASAATADHTHSIATAAAGAIQPDDAAAEGISASFSRADHKHSNVAAVAGTSTPGDVAAEGVATSFSRSDHVHARETIPAVKVNRSATQSINNNTITLLNWNQEQYDTAAMHDNTTNNDRLTCVVAGLHHFQLNLEFAADADGFRGIHIVHSVAGIIAKFYLPAVVVAISPILYCAVDYQMTVGQYVYAEAWHTAGNALLVGNSLWDAFSGRWVRP